MKFTFSHEIKRNEENTSSHAKFKMSFRLMNYNLQKRSERSKCFGLMMTLHSLRSDTCEAVTNY